jgi:hypothetical protein
MSDEQTTMSNDMLEKIVCAIVEWPLQLKKIYVDEAKHVALDISARLAVSLSQVPLAPAVSTSASNFARSREADDSRAACSRSRTLNRSRMLPVRELARA